MEPFQPCVANVLRYEPLYQPGVCLESKSSCRPHPIWKFVVYCGDDDDDEDGGGGGGDYNVAKAAAAAAAVTTTLIVVTIVIRVASVCTLSCPSVRVTAWNNSAPSTIFMTFDV